MSTFPLKVHTGAVDFSSALLLVCSPISDRTALLSFSLMEIANSDFPLYIFDDFPAIVNSVVLIFHFMFSVVARILSMTGSIRNFEK